MVHTTPNVRVPRVIAFPLAGLALGDPRLIPGLALVLPPPQRRELAEALQRAPQPQQIIERLRQALQRREPLARIVERLAREPALLPQRRPWPTGYSAAGLPGSDWCCPPQTLVSSADKLPAESLPVDGCAAYPG